MWAGNEFDTTIEDRAEFYRQNYEDALDLIRELKWRIKELESAQKEYEKNEKK